MDEGGSYFDFPKVLKAGLDRFLSGITDITHMIINRLM